MPNIKSAEKRMRSSEKKQLRNKSIRSQCKTNITKAEKMIFSGEKEAGREAVVTAISSLDKAVRKGVIHANNAARRKSRLMNKLNNAKPAPPKKATPEVEKETPPPAEPGE